MASSWDRLFDQVAAPAPADDFDALFDRVAKPAKPAASEWERRGIFLVNKRTGEKKLVVPQGAKVAITKEPDPYAGRHPLAVAGEQVKTRVVEGMRSLADLPLLAERARKGLDVASARAGEEIRLGRRALPPAPSGLIPEALAAAGRAPATGAEQGMAALRAPYLKAKDDLATSMAARGASPLASAATDTGLEAAALALDPTNFLPAGSAVDAARAARASTGRAVPGLADDVAAGGVAARSRAIADDVAGPVVPRDFDDFVWQRGFDPENLAAWQVTDLRREHRIALHPDETRFANPRGLPTRHREGGPGPYEAALEAPVTGAPRSLVEARAGEAGYIDTEAARSLARWTRENFTSAGRYRTAADDFSGQAEEFVLSIPKRKEQMEAAHRAEMYKKDLLLQGLDKEVGKVAPTRAARRDVYRQMHQAAVGELPLEQLPPSLQPYVQRGSQLVDDLSDAMVREGAIPQPLQAIVAQNKGKYRHRAYQAFDDPTWGRRVEGGEVEGGMQRWDDAKRFLQAELPDAADDEILGLMRQMADRPQGAEALALYSGSPSKINDVLKRRQNIPAPLRRLMGEYDDFRVSLDKTVHNLAWDLETHKMLRGLAAEGEPLGVFRAADAGPAGKLYQPVPGSDAVSGMSSRSPLADMLTTPGLRRALQSELELAKTTWWQKLSGWTKAGKIVQNPAGIARNFLAHTLTTTANGRQPLDPRLLLGVRRTFRDPLLREEAIRHNVMGQGFAAGEADQYIKWIEASSESPLAQGYNWINRKMATGFHGGDDFWKVYNWLGETQDQMWARGLSREEAMKLAADRVSDSFPTYSRAPSITQKVRSMPILGSPGATFGIESARVLKNNAKFAVLDIKEGLATGNQRLVALGMKRALGMVVGAAGVGAVAMRSRQKNGMTLEQADALRRRVLPRYHQDSELVITDFEPGKSVSYVDLSFLNPFNAVSKPLLAAMRANREDAGPAPAVVEVLETVLGGDIAAVGAFETLTGTRVESLYPPQAGPEIFSWDEPAGEVGKKMAYEGFQNFAPGYMVQGERLLRGAGVLPSQLESGREFKLGQEAVAIAGVRQSTYDIPSRLRGAVKAANGRLAGARARLRSATRVGGLSEDEANTFLDDWTTSYEEMRATVQDARLLGLSRAEVARITQEAGAIPATAAFALSGRETPPPPVLRPSTPEEGKAFRLLMEIYRQRYHASEEPAP